MLGLGAGMACAAETRAPSEAVATVTASCPIDGSGIRIASSGTKAGGGISITCGGRTVRSKPTAVPDLNDEAAAKARASRPEARGK
jgi:hypothetical protein